MTREHSPAPEARHPSAEDLEQRFPLLFAPPPATSPEDRRGAPTDRLDDVDPSFVVDWQTYDDPDDDGQRWSTWHDVEPLCRGPEPRPDWVVTSRGAVDTDLGILKTGKEADVSLLERADPLDPGGGVVLAAKRYRSPEHRTFHRAAAYTEGRSMRRSRDRRAVKRGSTFGRRLAAGEWAASEWEMLKRFWVAGVPVPYPVQVDGTEILMEWVSVEGEHGRETAPRLAQARPTPALLASWFDQLRAAMLRMAELGVVHGDLSAYNLLVAGDRLVVIDLPQVVDLVGNLNGTDFLARDCANVCGWFRSRGLDVDDQELLGDVLAQAY